MVCEQLGGGWHRNTRAAALHGCTRRRLYRHGRGRDYRSNRTTGLAFGINSGDELLGGDGTAVTHHQFCQHAGSRSRNFKHHLVSLDFDQDFIDGDGIAHLFLPLQQGGLSHRLRQLRYFYFNDSHIKPLFIQYLNIRGKKTVR